MTLPHSARARGVLLGLALVVSACNLRPGPTATPQVGTTNTPPAAPSPAAPPTRTPGPPITLLILPSDTRPDLAQQAQTAIGDLAQSAGTLFRVQPALRPAELPDDLAFIILIAPASADDIAASLAQAPEARIVAPAAEGLATEPRLTLLQPPQDGDLRQAFLAGFTSALITKDYRVAILLAGSAEPSPSIADSFRAGAEYYCGLCRPERPPFEDYPLTFPDGFGGGSLTSLLSGSGVQTVYLPADLSASSAITDLSASGLTLLGASPPPPELDQQWAVSFLPSPVSAIQASWQDIIGNAPPGAVTMPIQAQYVNDALLSPGRLRLVVQTQTDLSLGLLDVVGGP